MVVRTGGVVYTLAKHIYSNSKPKVNNMHMFLRAKSQDQELH